MLFRQGQHFEFIQIKQLLNAIQARTTFRVYLAKGNISCLFKLGKHLILFRP